MPLRITSLEICDGTQIPMEPGSIVFVVDPDNVGKTRALREIQASSVTKRT